VSRDIRAGPAVDSARGSAASGSRTACACAAAIELSTRIGAGAFGTVCVGEDESTGHRVAIRFLPRDSPRRPRPHRRSFAWAARSLPLDVASRDGPRAGVRRARRRPAVHRDGVRRGTPTQRDDLWPCADGRCRRLRIMLELGGAVETLHNMGFIHGAVSPRNVVVLEEWSRQAARHRAVGPARRARVQGLLNIEPPAEYLSPEQIQKPPSPRRPTSTRSA